MSDTTDTPERQNNQWMSPAQAAAALGVSERTIHRRLAGQRYEVRHVDGRTLIRLPNSRSEAPLSGVTADVSDVADPPTDTLSDTLSDASDGWLGRRTRPTDTSDSLADTVRQSIRVLQQLLEQKRQRAEEERVRTDRERDRAGQAEQAAAMWQERARNLEAENAKLQELLALPAHEEPEPPRRWWQRWRRAD